METPSTPVSTKKMLDRLEEPWTPQTSLAINAMNALKNMKSAPVQGHPKLGNLIRSQSDLCVHRPDLGLLDLFVDDGTNGNLDKGLRSLRFSAAASSIDRLFKPKSKEVQVNALLKPEDTIENVAPVTLNENVPSESIARAPISSRKEPEEDDDQKAIKENPTIPVESIQKKRSSLTEETDASQKVKDNNGMNANTITGVNETPESLNTEQVTPPHAAHKQVENTLGNEQPPVQESPGSVEETASPRLSPAQLLKSTLQKARRLSSLFSKTSAASDGDGEGGNPGNPQNNSSIPKEESAPSPKKTGSQLRQLLSKLSSGRRNRSNDGKEDDQGMQGNQRAKSGVRFPKFFKRKSEEIEEEKASPSDGAFTGEDSGADTGSSSSPPSENRVQIIGKKVTEFLSMLVE